MGADLMSERPIGPIYVRDHVSSGMEKLLKKGGIVEGHDHNFDHPTIVFRGSLFVTKRNAEGVILLNRRLVRAPAYILIEKGMWHEFVSNEDGTLAHCIYPHRDPYTGDIVLEYNAWEPAYG
jgi:quercetin dioxygenase-like cupin family protein